MSGGLVLESLRHAYGRIKAVRDVSLAVGKGELVALLGPSGCGKSTVLRLAAGLEPLQAGRIDIDEQTVATPQGGLPPEQRSVGLMFQDFALFPHLSVLDNVAFGLTELPRQERLATARALLERLGVAELAPSYPHRLSGGEQQRVALARALAPKPKVMLLDEPFSGLDVVLRDRVRETSAAVLHESGTPTLMVTHDPEEAMLLADRVALMRDGLIVQEGPPDVLYREPVDAFCAAFLGDVNRYEVMVQGGHVDTALGRFTATGMQDGEMAAVLIRPEALTFDGADGIVARVHAVHSLGRSARVELAIGDGGAARARVPWHELPSVGADVFIMVNSAMVFVFPAADS